MKDKIILYDDNCPMCCAYTKAFIKVGLLEEDGRIPFSELAESNLACQLDLDRSRHEIPLVDKNQTETIYGLDSMLTILEQKIPFLVKVARFRPFYLVLEQFYKFVSYNRQIIAAKANTTGRVNHKMTTNLTKFPTQSNHFDCSPDFHLFYRLTYLLFAFGLSALIFSQLTIIHTDATLIGCSLFGLVSFIAFRNNLWDWLGHLGTSLLIGALFLMPFFLIPAAPMFLLSIPTSGLILYQLIHRIRLIGY